MNQDKNEAPKKTPPADDPLPPLEANSAPLPPSSGQPTVNSTTSDEPLPPHEVPVDDSKSGPAHFEGKMHQPSKLKAGEQTGHGKSFLRRSWKITTAGAAIVAALVAFLADIGDVRTLVGNLWTPKVDIAFYKTENGSLHIAKDGPDVALTAQDLAEKRVEIPINLALRNRDGKTLEVLEIQLSYSKDLKVTPGGKARIDESNRLLIYEHNLGTIVSSDYYNPLESLDTISVPFDFDESGAVGLIKDGIPLYALTIVGLPKGKVAQKDIDLGVTVYFKDRPPVSARKRIRMFVVAKLQAVLPHFPGFVSPSPVDICLFRHPPSGIVLAQWQGRISSNDPLIHYKKIRANRAIYQLVFVDQKLRRLIADVNGDGLIDFELWRPDTKGAKLLKGIPRNPGRMIDWKPMEP